MTQPTCNACGALVAPDASFCGKCGRPVASPDALSGGTRLGPTGGEADTLSGSTRMGAMPVSDDVLGGSTRGLTMFGKAVDGPPADIEALPPGAMFDGRYTVVQLLGQGGMGAVYEAVDTRLRQIVALKALRPEVASRADVIDMLAGEVALSQRLTHPNLLQVRHFEPKGAVPYVVMELMDGGDLAEKLASKGGKLASDEALRFMDGVLAGLSALHDQRIAHLDLKPQNVLLTKDGTPKLADFGISSRLKDQRGGGRGAGTVEYAPPEQLRGEPCDVRADVYAAGMMLHELLTGRFPFGRSLAEARDWHEKGARSFPMLAPSVAAVVAKCTAVGPDERYRTAQELRSALKAALEKRGWWSIPPAVVESLRSRVAEVIRVDGTEEPYANAESLLAQGAARPGWRTLGGKVVLETTGLALVAVGIDRPKGDAVFEAGRTAVGGRPEALHQIGPQSALVDARLSIAALLGGDKEEALVRTSRAASTAKEPSEWMAVAEAQAALGQDYAASLQTAASKASEINTRLDATLLRYALRGDAAEAFTAVQSAGEKASDAEALAVAQAYRAVGATDRYLDGAVERWRRHSGAASGLDLALKLLGVRPTLVPWASALDGAATTVKAHRDVAALWRRLGDVSKADAAAARAEAGRAALHQRLVAAQAIWAATGHAAPAIPSGADEDEQATERYEQSASSERSRHERALGLTERARGLFVAVPTWSRPYREAEFEACAKRLEAEAALLQRATELARQMEAVALPVSEWTRPFVATELETASEAVAQQQAWVREASALDAEAKKLGLEVETKRRPFTAEALTALRAIVEAQRALQKQADALTREASELGASAVGWTRPVTRDQLERESERLHSARASAQALERQAAELDREASAIGLPARTWKKPLTEEPIAARRADVHRQSEWLGEVRRIEAEATKNGWSLGPAPAMPLSNEAVASYRAKLTNAAASVRRRRWIVVASVALVVAVAVGMVVAQREAAAKAESERVEAAAKAESERVEAAAKAESERAEDLKAGRLRVVAGAEFRFALIPAGRFEMGSQSGESEASDSERPRHAVVISRPFLLARTETTQAQWSAVMGSDPSRFKGSQRPVESVSWNDAVSFCDKLSSLDGASQGTYRLPTEAEWEYAARAGSDEPRYGALDEVAWHSENSDSQTHDVGGKKANAWGLHDTLGNVWEWTGDWFGSYGGSAATDPTGPASGSGRVFRGGSWIGEARYVRAAYRSYYTPVNRSDFLGFRPLRSLP